MSRCPNCPERAKVARLEERIKALQQLLRGKPPPAAAVASSTVNRCGLCGHSRTQCGCPVGV